MAILFLVGQRKEQSSIVDDLLDVTQWPCKPQYNIASELPLVLFDSYYKNIEWICEKGDIQKIIKHFQDIWLIHQMKATVLKRMIDHVEIDNENMEKTTDAAEVQPVNETTVVNDNIRNLDQPYVPLQGKTIALSYVKLEKRRTAKSLENRVDHYIKRKKIDKDFVEEKIAFTKNYMSKK
jgi:tRNA pseudouridine38/39 synthase